MSKSLKSTSVSERKDPFRIHPPSSLHPFPRLPTQTIAGWWYQESARQPTHHTEVGGKKVNQTTCYSSCLTLILVYYPLLTITN